MNTLSALLRTSGSTRPYGESRPITFEELQLEAPDEGEVLVRIEAAGVCHSDLSVVNGDRVRPLPMALGHEAAGIVVETGPNVTGLEPGDHVVMVYVPSCGECVFCIDGQPALCERGAASNGAGELLSGGRRLRDSSGEIHHHLGVSAFAQYAVVHQSSAVKVDKDVPFDVAALFGCAMSTGYGAVTRTAGVGAGETVAIIGLGGVGLSAVIAAHAVGASRILAVDPVQAKRDLALELGATEAGHPDELLATIESKWEHRPQWVFEAVGSGPVLEQAFAITGRGGTTVSMGLPHPSVELRIPALTIIAESRTIKGSYMGSTRPQVDIPAMVDLWRAGRLPVEKLISSRRELTELNEALDELAEGTAIRQILFPHQEAKN